MKYRSLSYVSCPTDDPYPDFDNFQYFLSVTISKIYIKMTQKYCFQDNAPCLKTCLVTIIKYSKFSVDAFNSYSLQIILLNKRF